SPQSLKRARAEVERLSRELNEARARVEASNEDTYRSADKSAGVIRLRDLEDKLAAAESRRQELEDIEREYQENQRAHRHQSGTRWLSAGCGVMSILAAAAGVGSCQAGFGGPGASLVLIVAPALALVGTFAGVFSKAERPESRALGLTTSLVTLVGT